MSRAIGRRRFCLYCALVLALLVLLPHADTAAAPACTITWDGGGGGASWHTGANWDTNVVPGVADHVCIGTGVAVIYSTGTTSVLTVTSAGTLSVTGGTLNLTDAVESSSLFDLALAGGTIGGAGTFTVGHTFSWTGGSLAGAGTTTIAAGATLVREAQNTVFLADGRLLEVEGTLDLRTDRFITPSGAPAPLIHNTGTVVKSAGAGIATITVALENDGVVRSDSGTLDLRGGDGPDSSDGDYGSAAPLGVVRLGAGQSDLADGARLLGGVSVDGATVNVVEAATATASGANTLASGALGGTGTLEVTGTLTWTGGSLDDAGTTTIKPAATLVRDGANTVFLSDGRLLDVQGTLDLRTDRFTTPSGAPAPLIRNTGTVVKSAGAGTATITVALENDGVVKSDSGTLDLRGGDGLDSSDGDYGSAAPLGVVRLGAGQSDLADGARLLGGVSVDGATVNVLAAATATASGANTLASGVLGGTGTLDVTGTLTWTGGSLDDAGTTRIKPAATLVRDGANTVFLSDGRLLEVQGTLDLRTDRFITPSGAPAPLLRNTGTVVKSAGAGTATITVALENDGVVRSDSGTLDLRGGDGAGSSDGDYLGAVRLAAGQTDLADGARLLGGVSVDGSTVNVVAAATATASGANTLASGALGGTGTFEVTGTLTWTGGAFNDAGTTRIKPAATLVRDGANTVFLSDGRLLEVQGTLDLRTDRFITPSGAPAPSLRNTGTVVKSAGAGTATISAALENDGVVRSDSGTLDLRGGDGAGSSSGDWGGSAGALGLAAGTFDLVGTPRLLGGVSVNGARLTVADGVTATATGTNGFSSGAIDGAGTFKIDGPFAWPGGTMEGAGQTLVLAGREVTLPSCCPSLAGTRRLVNQGTIAVDGGRLFASADTRLENNARIELRGGDEFEELSGPGRLLNSGTIEKTAGATRSTVEMTLANSGTVTSAAGLLVLGNGDGDGSQSGSFGATGGGEVVFEFGEWDLGPGSQFTGGVTIAGADISVPSRTTLPVAGAAKLIDGGRILGGGTVEILGAFTWSDGSMEESGLTVVAPPASLTIDSTFGVSLSDGRRLLNRGTIGWVKGDIDAFDATVINQGTIDAQGDDAFQGGFGFSGFSTLLHNTGTIRKSGGAGTSEFTAEIDNDGTFEASSGTIALQGLLLNYSGTTNSLTGGAYVARDATLELPGTPLGVNAATIVLDGATARLLSREFPGDPPVDALASLLRNAGAGELRLEGGAELATSGALRNAGLVEIGVDSTLTAGGAYTQAGGRTELTDPTSRLAAASYAQTGGRLAVETAAAGVGRVEVSGAAALGGTLSVDTRAGFSPVAGSTFRFLQAGSRTGTFGSLIEVAPGIDYEVDYDATGAALRVAGVSAPPPAPPREPMVAPPPPSDVVDDRALAVLSGPWTRKAAPEFYGGTYTMSSKRGARLVRAGVEARQLVLLASTCRGCGSLEAYWNGRLLKWIPLGGRPSRKRLVLATFASTETGTLVLRVASRRQVRIDGLVATR